MDDPDNQASHSAEIKTVLPDVVHSQQIPAVGEGIEISDSETEQLVIGDSTHDVEESRTESVSEHIPSNMDYSLSGSEQVDKSYESQDPHQLGANPGLLSKNSSLNIPIAEGTEHLNVQDSSQKSTSWADNALSDLHFLGDESPVNLAPTSDTSKDDSKDVKPKTSEVNSQKESFRSDAEQYADSLNEESVKFSDISAECANSLESTQSCDKDVDKDSVSSEEIIKLDIRGSSCPRFPIETEKIFFGPPPEGSIIIDPPTEALPVFQNLLSPFLVGAGDNINLEELFTTQRLNKESSPVKSDSDASFEKQSFSNEQSDLLVEEITVDDIREKEVEEKQDEDTSLPTQAKSTAAEENMSMSTMTTDYKTICEEYHEKLVHLEDAITQRDQLIQELTISLQQSVREQDDLRVENKHLTNEVHSLQHIVGERSVSDHDTVKGQLSDFMKYQTMVKDDSTKFYSALMSGGSSLKSGGSSLKSSNGEKDIDREEITVNYSRSDLKSSGSSDGFQTGFENKVSTIISKFDEYIEENLRNKLRESLIQVLCDEIGKMRIDSDTEMKELEAQLVQNRQAYTTETRKLRELLSSVKAGNADIDELREELNVKHEKEMENLRTYFEKKCCDMERSYSEEVWRAARGSASSLEGGAGGAGGDARRRTRSAEFPSLPFEASTPFEHNFKYLARKYEQQIEDMKSDHVAYVNDLQARHRETLQSLEEQITQLKAHIQTTENTDANVSLYQQDIDLELEKKCERKIEQVRAEVAQQLQEQIQVLLSDPDAEVSSWPLELVALRDRIHGDRLEKELSSLTESPAAEDKWKQRRNYSFDQNRQLEEVTKERDGLKRVASTLQHVVEQLVAYCACAEDELNRTVLAKLLDESSLILESRPGSPTLDVSLVKEKHVHFAPDLHSILTELDEEGIAGYLQKQRDLSSDIKRSLEHSLQRLRHEAHELLALATKLAVDKSRRESKMLESSVQISELVESCGERRQCDNCEFYKKTMEEAMSECLQRESLLRSDLEAAMIKIAHLMTADPHGNDVIAEGYGTLQSLPTYGRGSPRPRPASESNALSHSVARPGSLSHSHSLEPSPRATEIELLQRERDDLQQQLEAANRQLRSSRAFVEEQAAEREAERDESARREADLRAEAARLAARLQANARIVSEMHGLQVSQCTRRRRDRHVEQLEQQSREMNQIIADLEMRRATTDEELKATEEKISLLRDIIADLESQLEQKTTHEAEVLEQLTTMKNTIEERDSKLRAVVSELESLRSERMEQSDVTCVKCGQEEDNYSELMEKVKEQCLALEAALSVRTRVLERAHECCSLPAAERSERSEDVSLSERRRARETPSPERPPSPPPHAPAPLARLWEGVTSLTRAEDAALRRVVDLEAQRDRLAAVAQEVRAERDVLQARMSEQALRISSLAARLQRQRNDAQARAHEAASQLGVQLHDALAEVQRLKDELDTKDKQLARMKQTMDERDRQMEQQHTLYGNTCNPKDKVIILERELASTQTRICTLESLARSLEEDKEHLHTIIKDQQRTLAEKEDQLQELLALKLDDEQKDEKSDIVEAKVSARTLSDIVSISEFDEQDLQMRRAELKGHNLSLTGAPFVNETRDKSHLNKTLPPDLDKPNMSSLQLDCHEHFDIPSFTARADSLPAHLTSTQNKDQQKNYKRNVDETTVFSTIDKLGELKQSGTPNIPDNCSMYPNRDASDNKSVGVEPKKINFSLEVTNDNRSQEDFISLRDLGITLDIRQENFPDILTQLKHEIKKSRTELEDCKSELKNAEEQLCEFPALKEEVEELKGLLENTMATMETDKKFYENQLDNFSSNKKLLEQRLSELTQEVGDKSKDLHLLKEDILRRENMILELAKEKRNLTNKMTELEVKIDEIRSRNDSLEKYELENRQMREKMIEFEKLEQLVSEKNQQIDSLNQHLDRLDNMQRDLSDKTDELENFKEALEEKTNEVFHLQDTLDAVNREIGKVSEENNLLNIDNKELKLKLTKLEKEQENVSLKLQNSESELERISSLNNELTSKLEELKIVTDKLKDKETEIEILNEDINSFHEEIASLKEQLKMISRSPSPRSKSGDEKRTPDRQAGNDKKQLAKIRKQISLLQHELDFNKKELNDKAFELAKAKLDLTELRGKLSDTTKLASDKDAANALLLQQSETARQQMAQLMDEKRVLSQQLEMVVNRIKEESNLSEVKVKLRNKTDRCHELENEVKDLKDLVDRLRTSAPAAEEMALVRSGRRSPTAELERALRDQLHYSHKLDEDIMEQILSGSSDEREDIPRLALNTSKSTSSFHSSSSELARRLRSDNDRLTLQVNNLELRLKDKEALITELNRIRDKLLQDCQTAKLRYEAERDNSGRLQLLLDTQKETAESLQNQDSNMIQILKKRLESAMQSQLELQQKEQLYRTRLATETKDSGHAESTERLNSEIILLRSRLDAERTRYADLHVTSTQAQSRAVRQQEEAGRTVADLKAELAELKRLKHEANVELLRCKELINVQSSTIAELERKLANTSNKFKPVNDALTEIETHKSELAREMSALKQCLKDNQLASDQERLARGDKDQAIRYLHGRCLRLESCRKALVWQKRYLQRVLAGYAELERTLRLPSDKVVEVSRGKNRFRCVARVVMIVFRMGFLVRRRQHVRALSSNCILKRDGNTTKNTPTMTAAPTSPPSRGPVSPATPAAAALPPRGLPRRLLRHDTATASPRLEFMQGSPFYSNTSHTEPFILSTPRGDMATAYLNKLELVSRCLNQAMDTSRDVP